MFGRKLYFILLENFEENSTVDTETDTLHHYKDTGYQRQSSLMIFLFCSDTKAVTVV